MTVAAVYTLANATMGSIGTQMILVLTATIAVAAAYFLFKFAWKRIKGSVR